MHAPTAPFRRLFALSLLAWVGMVFAQSPVSMSMRAGTNMPEMHAATAHTNEGAAVAHRTAAMADHAPCCGHDGHVAGSCHTCGCVNACAAVVLPPVVTASCAPSADRESVSPGCLRLAAMVTAPPLRPPAA
jgi:hypothetical protein